MCRSSFRFAVVFGMAVVGGGVSGVDAQTVVSEAWNRPEALTSLPDWATDMAIDQGGNIYVTGWKTVGTNQTEWITVRYTTTGSIDSNWSSVKYFGPIAGLNKAFGIALSGDGGVYVVGQAVETSGGNLNYAVVRYAASNGAEQAVAWYNAPDNPGDDIAIDVAVADNDYIYVTGQSWGGSSTGWDIATLSYEYTGSALSGRWTPVRYDQPGSDIPVKITAPPPPPPGEGAADGFYVAGTSDGSTTGQDVVVLKYDPDDGSTESGFPVRYESSDADVALDMALAGNAPVVVGYTVDPNTDVPSNADYLIVHWSAAGSHQWTYTYNGAGSQSDYATAVVTGALDNLQTYVWATGVSYSGASTGNDITTIRLNIANPTGSSDPPVVATYPVGGNAGDDGGVDIAVAKGDLFVTGRIVGTGGTNFRTIKYDNVTGSTPSMSVVWAIAFNSSANLADVPVRMMLSLAYEDEYPSPDDYDEVKIIVTGGSEASSGNYDVRTVKYVQPVIP